MFRKKSPQEILDGFLGEAKQRLGDNLATLAVYGSFVRGNFREGRSDINLLVVLRDSDAGAHKTIASLAAAHPAINPFVVGMRGMERSMKVFTLKFSSIRRNYRVLHGEDPFEGWRPDPALERFVAEQQLRNLRFRLIHAYTARQRRKPGLSGHMTRLVPSLYTDISALARLAGKTVPVRFEERAGVFEETFGIGFEALKRLSDKANGGGLNEAEAEEIYGGLITLLNGVISWMEERWALPHPVEVTQ